MQSAARWCQAESVEKQTLSAIQGNALLCILFPFVGTPVEPQPMKRNLTNAFVRSVKATDGKRFEVGDEKVGGLILRVTPAGHKSWSFLYRRKSDGKRRRVTIGKYPAITLEQARYGREGRDGNHIDGALDYQRQVSDGGDPAGNVTARRAELTFREFADEYIERYAKKRKRSWKKDRRILNHDVIPQIGDMKVSEIRKRDILKILDKVQDRGAPIQSNRVFEIVRKSFNYAIARDQISVSPCIGIERPSPEQSRDRTLNPPEIERFWKRLSETSMWWCGQQVLRLCLVTGQRVSEVSEAPKRELDLSSAVWEIASERAKNGRSHRIPLSPLAVDLFREAIEQSGNSEFVFPGAILRGVDRPLSGNAITKGMHRSLETLNLEDVTPHDLRRTCASGMAELGFSRLIVDKVLNHAGADSGVSGVYDRYEYEREKRQALEAWAARLQEITTGEQMPDQVVPLRR